MTSVRALLVGISDAVADDLEQGGIGVERVDTVEEASVRLADGEPQFHCVVGPLDSSEGPALELPAAVHERAALLPVVLVGESPLESVAEELLAADIEEYVVVGEEGTAALHEAIEEAAASYRQRLDRIRVHEEHPDPACVIREGVVVVASEGFADHFGVATTEDLVGDSLLDVVVSEDRDGLEAALADAGTDPEGLWVSPVTDYHRTVELRFRRSAVDDAIVVRAVDVTAQAHRHEAMAKAAAELDSLLRNIPMSIYFKDELGRHERVSHYITHTDPEDYIMNDEGKVHPHADDVIGKTDFDLYGPEFAEQTYEDDMNVIENEERVVNRIESGTTSLGEPLYTSTTKVPRYDENGEVVGLVGVTIDVTERVTHREELERQNARLNEFAEVLTHDLRNPLNIANGYLDVLEETYDQDAVEEVSNALGRMEALIDEIRAFVLEGRLVEEPEAVDLRAVAEEAWSTADTGDATLEVDGELELQADRSRLRRLLENLFRNSVEHGRPAADGELTIRVVAGDHEFAVEDDGVGIPADDRGEIFERGFTTSEDGTGFGLAIVQSIAQAHGWSVSVEESAEGGARFVFSDVVLAQLGLGRTIS